MDYDISIEILRQVRGDEVVVRLVRALVEPSYEDDFTSVSIWPKSRQIEFRNEVGRYDRLPWPADWSPDPDYTHPDHEAALVALATRLAVDEWQRRRLAVAEWQRRQEGGQ